MSKLSSRYTTTTRKEYPSAPRKNYNITEGDSFLRSNLRIVTICLLVFAAGILLTLVRWQILDHEKWTLTGKSQYIEQDRQATSRGTIYASDGSILAIDEPAWGVFASLSTDPVEREEFFKNKEKYVTEVATILGIAGEDVAKLLTNDFRYATIMHGVSSEKKNALEKLKVSEKMPVGFGLYFEKEEKRVYPDGKLASHVLGFMGKDPDGNDIGMYGIEGYYFGDLQALKGSSYSEKDSQGNVILTSNYDPLPQRQGKSLTLTIKPGIQTKVEKVLKQHVEKTQSKSGTAILMEPTTGAIIAMAGYPDYDPNEYWKAAENRVYTNMSISMPYEFGSVQSQLLSQSDLNQAKLRQILNAQTIKATFSFPTGREQ